MSRVVAPPFSTKNSNCNTPKDLIFWIVTRVSARDYTVVCQFENFLLTKLLMDEILSVTLIKQTLRGGLRETLKHKIRFLKWPQMPQRGRLWCVKNHPVENRSAPFCMLRARFVILRCQHWRHGWKRQVFRSFFAYLHRSLASSFWEVS